MMRRLKVRLRERLPGIAFNDRAGRVAVAFTAVVLDEAGSPVSAECWIRHDRMQELLGDEARLNALVEEVRASEPDGAPIIP